MSRAVRLFLMLALILSCADGFPSRAQSDGADEMTVNGSLEELRNKRRVLLMVRRSAVVDASGAATPSVLSEVDKQAVGARPQSFPRTYNSIAKKLNKYMNEYGSITAARSIADADFIVFFNVLEIRRPLGTPYAYGELFVILNQAPQPRIIWKTRKSGMFAEDAINALIRDMKMMRGER